MFDQIEVDAIIELNPELKQNNNHPNISKPVEKNARVSHCNLYSIQICYFCDINRQLQPRESWLTLDLIRFSNAFWNQLWPHSRIAWLWSELVCFTAWHLKGFATRGGGHRPGQHRAALQWSVRRVVCRRRRRRRGRLRRHRSPRQPTHCPLQAQQGNRRASFVSQLPRARGISVFYVPLTSLPLQTLYLSLKLIFCGWIFVYLFITVFTTDAFEFGSDC